LYHRVRDDWELAPPATAAAQSPTSDVE